MWLELHSFVKWKPLNDYMYYDSEDQDEMPLNVT